MKTFAFLAAALLAATASLAQTDERRITVNGTGTVEAVPDMATITLGVTNENAEAVLAMQATSEAVTQILARLEEMGIESRDVQTRDLSLSPVWTGRRGLEGEVPRITGFVASNPGVRAGARSECAGQRSGCGDPRRRQRFRRPELWRSGP